MNLRVKICWYVSPRLFFATFSFGFQLIASNCSLVSSEYLKFRTENLSQSFFAFLNLIANQRGHLFVSELVRLFALLGPWLSLFFAVVPSLLEIQPAAKLGFEVEPSTCWRSLLVTLDA